VVGDKLQNKLNLNQLRKLSIVSVCYDRWEFLKLALPYFFDQSYPNIEYIFVIGHNDVAQSKILHATGKDVTIVELVNDMCYRASRFRNIGGRLATGRDIAFVDCDVWLDKSWCTVVATKLANMPRGGIVVNDFLLHGRDAGGSTGTLAISKWLFERIGHYDESFDTAWGYEDTDIIVRAQLAGGSIDSYAAKLTSHNSHTDDLRNKHFVSKEQPRSPAIFLRHLQLAQENKSVHPFMANIINRVGGIQETYKVYRV